jgi:hypothetical protein
MAERIAKMTESRGVGWLGRDRVGSIGARLGPGHVGSTRVHAAPSRADERADRSGMPP